MEQVDKWQIVAKGTIVEGKERAEVIEVLKSRFRYSDATIDVLLNGRQRIIKKGLDQDSARKYEQLLLAAGVQVTAQRMPNETDALSSAGLSLEQLPGEEARPTEPEGTAQVSPSPTRIGPGQMQCPKCKSVQPKSTECASCGVIISRYRPAANENEPRSVSAAGGTGNLLDLQTLGVGVGIVAVLMLAYLFLSSPESLHVGTTPEAMAQAEAVLRSRARQWPDMNELRRLVQNGDYHGAEAFIRELHDQTMADINWEDAYEKTVLNLNKSYGFSLDSMNRWVDASGSAIAYLARGTYYYSAAQDARGSRYARNTSEAQFAEQRRLAKKSQRDLEYALALDKELIPAYSMLIWLSTARAMDIDKIRVLEDAITVAPGAYRLRSSYIGTLSPKWGGSFPAMEAFADEAVSYLQHNPRLWLLKGMIYQEMGNRAWENQDCDGAIAHYTDALEYGINPDWLNQRAYCLAQQGEYEQALADIDRTLKHYPKNEYALEVRPMLEEKYTVCCR